MAAPTLFVRSLLRYILENGSGVAVGRAAVLAIVTGNFSTVLTTGGGKQLIGASAAGKSFTYSIPEGLDVMELMGYAEEALSLWDGLGEDAIEEMLETPPIRKTRAVFGSA